MAEPVKHEVKATSVSIPPMASPVSPENTAAPPPAATSLKGRLGFKARTFGGERTLARVLRTGAVLSGALFVSSVALEALPQTQGVAQAIDVLRKVGVGVLVVTPLARLCVASALLTMRGERRFALYGAGVLALLGLALGAGFGA